MQLRSSAYRDRESMPMRYTADGEDLSPPLAWSDVPPNARSLALVVDDPDAQRTWTHWVVLDLPAASGSMNEGASRHALPEGAREGRNDFQKVGWGGPAPPHGRHRYVHKLYALDCALPQLLHPSKAELEQAMRGHVLAQAELIGTYAR